MSQTGENQLPVELQLFSSLYGECRSLISAAQGILGLGAALKEVGLVGQTGEIANEIWRWVFDSGYMTEYTDAPTEFAARLDELLTTCLGGRWEVLRVGNAGAPYQSPTQEAAASTLRQCMLQFAQVPERWLALAREAVELMHARPSDAVLRARNVKEAILSELKSDDESDLDAIRNIPDQAVRTHLNSIHFLGNQAAHYQERPLTELDAQVAVTALIAALRWYANTHASDAGA